MIGDDKMGKKFKTSKVLLYVAVFYFILSLSMFLFFSLDTHFQNEIFLNITLIMMLLVAPIISILWMIKITFFDVYIDEKGVSKYRFNKLVYHISWNELKDVRFYNPVCPWIVFSKESLNEVGFEKARSFMNTISILYVKEMGEEINKWCTDESILFKVKEMKDQFNNSNNMNLGEVRVQYESCGNVIQVYNSINTCSLVINGEIVDQYNGVVATIFCLKGFVVVDGENVSVEAKMGHLYMRLFYNGIEVAKEFIGLG